MMRFLCMCVVILSGLVAVRCFVSTPNSLDAAANILRAVLANDEDWALILFQKLKVKEVDVGTMLADLKLTYEPDTWITPNDVIQRLVTHGGTTGSQLLFGIRLLGIALNTQFMSTLMVHSYLASKFAEHKGAEPTSLRVSISKIQMVIVNFTNKAAFFGHPIDVYRQLNDKINEFLKTNKELLNSNDGNMLKTTRDIISTFLSTLFEITKEKLLEVSNEYENVDESVIRDMMIDLELIEENAEGEFDEIKNMESRDLFSKTIQIEDYKQVNVSSIELDFIENRFHIEEMYTLTAEEPKIE